ncbi:hypothetical protein OH77DRAFT_466430 [Trametes cingulata]|nr:hypothetical protein OH77DRAFT_466430 [Trametes cingulata]
MTHDGRRAPTSYPACNGFKSLSISGRSHAVALGYPQCQMQRIPSQRPRRCDGSQPRSKRCVYALAVYTSRRCLATAQADVYCTSNVNICSVPATSLSGSMYCESTGVREWGGLVPAPAQAGGAASGPGGLLFQQYPESGRIALAIGQLYISNRIITMML